MLTATAAMTGPYSFIRLITFWKEPPIIWNIVAARKGEKKSAAMKIIKDAVEEVEKEMIGIYASDNNSASETVLPTIHMTNSQFTFTKLYHQMSENDGQCSLLNDEIAALYEQLDRNC